MIVPTLQKAIKRRSAISAPTAIWMARLCWSSFLAIPFSVALWLTRGQVRTRFQRRPRRGKMVRLRCYFLLW